MEGMPEPRDLRVGVCDGWTLVTVGCRVVAGYDSGDVGMRNVVVVMLSVRAVPASSVTNSAARTRQPTESLPPSFKSACNCPSVVFPDPGGAFPTGPGKHRLLHGQ